jgi:hypothetical protein
MACEDAVCADLDGDQQSGESSEPAVAARMLRFTGISETSEIKNLAVGSTRTGCMRRGSLLLEIRVRYESHPSLRTSAAGSPAPHPVRAARSPCRRCFPPAGRWCAVALYGACRRSGLSVAPCICVARQLAGPVPLSVNIDLSQQKAYLFIETARTWAGPMSPPAAAAIATPTGTFRIHRQAGRRQALQPLRHPSWTRHGTVLRSNATAGVCTEFLRAAILSGR